MLLPQEQSQLPYIHPPVWSNSSNLNSDALLAEALRPFSASSLALCRHFSCQDFVIAIFGLGSLLQCVYWGGFDKYGEKMGGNHCMYPVKFELKSSREGSIVHRRKNGSVHDT